jgi:hypothetical protein
LSTRTSSRSDHAVAIDCAPIECCRFQVVMRRPDPAAGPRHKVEGPGRERGMR